jgi:hypothetical protein
MNMGPHILLDYGTELRILHGEDINPCLQIKLTNMQAMVNTAPLHFMVLSKEEPRSFMLLCTR